MSHRAHTTIRQLIYVSTAVQLMQPGEVVELLRMARARNEELDVSGLLLYADGNFIQVIEGAPVHVEQLFRRIKRDPRHGRFIVLLDHMAEHRDFDGWRMGFEQPSMREMRELIGLADLNHPDAALRLLDSFRRTILHRFPSGLP